MTYQDLGNSRKAIEHYKETIKITPGSVDAHYNLGLIYMGNNNLREASGEFEAVLRIDPNFMDARDLLGKVNEGVIGGR